jgi:hypothetical protein
MNRRNVLSLALLSSAAITATAQAPNQQRMPPDYRGVQTVVPGIFVTPIPNAPFTATVDILSHEKLPNGTENVRTTSAQIARDSSGRIYNERRQLVPVTFQGKPMLLSAHIFDPATRLSIFLNPQTRLAREQILAPAVAARQMPAKPPIPNLWPSNPYTGNGDTFNSQGANFIPPSGPGAPVYAQSGPYAPPQRPAAIAPIKEVDLGDQIIDGTTLHGTEKLRTIPAELSTTGHAITITDQYWYSPDLAVYLIIKHNDPRTGEQIVGVTHIDRHEPPSTQFAVPATYKLVDETPPNN